MLYVGFSALETCSKADCSHWQIPKDFSGFGAAFVPILSNIFIQMSHSCTTIHALTLTVARVEILI